MAGCYESTARQFDDTSGGRIIIWTHRQHVDVDGKKLEWEYTDGLHGKTDTFTGLATLLYKDPAGRVIGQEQVQFIIEAPTLAGAFANFDAAKEIRLVEARKVQQAALQQQIAEAQAGRNRQIIEQAVNGQGGVLLSGRGQSRGR